MRKIILTITGVMAMLMGTSAIAQPHWLANLDPAQLTTLPFLTVAVLAIFCLMLLVAGLRSRKKAMFLAEEKSATENKLHEQQHLFETIFDDTHNGIALLNLDGRFLRANKSLCEMLGYSEADTLAMNFYYIIHPNDLNNLQVYIQQLLNDQIKVHQSEQQCFKKNGDLLWIMSTLSLIRDNEGKPIYFIIQVQDITLQKKSGRTLEAYGLS